MSEYEDGYNSLTEPQKERIQDRYLQLVDPITHSDLSEREKLRIGGRIMELCFEEITHPPRKPTPKGVRPSKLPKPDDRSIDVLIDYDEMTKRIKCEEEVREWFMENLTRMVLENQHYRQFGCPPGGVHGPN